MTEHECPLKYRRTQTYASAYNKTFWVVAGELGRNLSTLCSFCLFCFFLLTFLLTEAFEDIRVLFFFPSKPSGTSVPVNLRTRGKTTLFNFASNLAGENASLPGFADCFKMLHWILSPFLPAAVKLNHLNAITHKNPTSAAQSLLEGMKDIHLYKFIVCLKKISVTRIGADIKI